MKELGVNMIPSYSPQARGRSERSFSTWQGRLPQELRLRGIRTLEGANKFLNEHYIAEFNRRFTVPAAERGTAFISCRHRNLEMIFTERYERTVWPTPLRTYIAWIQRQCIPPAPILLVPCASKS
jgi:hypothetical protein